MSLSIQVDEKKLSAHAANALNNAKNKSQFLREAIEFYAQRSLPSLPDKSINQNIQADLKEIKELIRNLQIQAVSLQVQNDPLKQESDANVEQEIAVASVENIPNEDNLSSVKIPSCYDV